jgi:replicative DNA helicase
MASKFEKKVYKPVVLPVDVAGKIPPQAVDLEEAILGALLIEKEAIEEIYNDLVPEAFYKEANQKIYQAILNLYNKSEGIDIITVPNELRDMGVLDEVGGPYYVSMLSSKVASASHIKFHALVVKDKYFKRELIAKSHELYNMAYDDSIDSDTLIDNFQNGVEKAIQDYFGAQAMKTFPQLLDQSKEDYLVREALAKENKMSGVPTPLHDLTKLTGGFQNSDLIIIAARPSVGKTAWALSIMNKATESDYNCAMFSLEMPGVRLTDRIVCGEAQIDPNKYRSGLLNQYEKDKLDSTIASLRKRGIYIDDNSMQSFSYIRNKAKILKEKYGLGLILVDYLQLVHIEKAGRSRENEVANLSKSFKSLAKELDVPVIVLGQLNRQCELRAGNHRPIESDLRESGGIEADADLIMLLYRAAKYGYLEDEDGTSTKNMGEAIICKHRNGATDDIKWKHDDFLTRIYDYVEPSSMSGSGGSYEDKVGSIEASFLDPNTDFDNNDKPF